MKKIIFLSFFCLIFSSTVSSEYDILKINPNWGVHIEIDEFTDEKSCKLGPNNDVINVLFVNHATAKDNKEKHALFRANSQINNIGIRYRVDNNKPVLLGQGDYKYPKYASMYAVYGENYKKLVDNFKSGKEAIYQFWSKDEPANDKVYKINLMGFTEAYTYTVSCNRN